MNLREKLAALLKELEGAKTKDEVDRIKGEIMAVKAQIELADEKAAILDGMKATAPVGGHRAKATGGTLGQRAVAAVKAAGATRGERFNASTETKADGDEPATPSTPATSANPGPNMNPTGDYAVAVTETRLDVLQGARRETTIADLFAQETTDSAAITYFSEGAVDGSISTVAEGGKYPEIAFGEPVEHTDPVKKIGCLYRDTDELLEDAPRLASSIDNRADYLMNVEEEDQIISGDGKGTNIVGLLNRSGLQLAEFETLPGLIDQIKSAKVGIKQNTPRFKADTVLINDNLWDQITSEKDDIGRYLAADPFKDDGDCPKLWGLKVEPTQAVDEDTVVVGAFKASGAVIRRGGRNVDISNSDSDDFSNGRIAIRPSERLALAIYYPAGFVVITKKEPEKGGQ